MPRIIQFVYILAIPVLLKIVDYLVNRSSDNRNQLIIASIYFICIILGILSIWYLPFQAEWVQISKQQSGSFSLDKITVSLIWDNLKLNFLSKSYILFTGLFIFSFCAAIYQLVKKQYPSDYRTLLIICISWFILELHKLGLSYLPIRYLISFYLSMGFLISVVIGYYLSVFKLRAKMLIVLVLFVQFILNCSLYKQAFLSRSYTVQKMNNYFQKLTSENDVVIGPWAPGCTWETKCASYPIWNNFLAGRDIIKYYHPNFIVSEFNHEDSGSAYEKNNINLNNLCDSLTQAKVALWTLNVYRVKDKK
jgi:hypothetical protein